MGRIALEPGKIASLWGCPGNHHELVFGQPGDRQVGFDAAPLVAPLGIDDPARRDVDVVGRNPVQHLQGILALDQKLGEARLIEEHGIALECLRLGIGAGEPVLPPVGVFVFGLHASRRVPVGPLPAIDFAHAGPGRHQAVVNRRSPRSPRRLDLPVGPVHRIEEPQAFDRAVVHVALDRLERMDAADIDAAHIDGRVAVLDPLSEHEPSPT